MSEQFDAAKILLENGSFVYDAIALAEIKTDGVYIRDVSDTLKRTIPQNCEVIVRTLNSKYRLKFAGDDIQAICERNDNHKNHLPDWTKIVISGSTWGGSMLKLSYLGIGMFMEFGINGKGPPITTSEIQSISIREIK